MFYLRALTDWRMWRLMPSAQWGYMREHFWCRMAYRLPQRLVYWCALRVIAHASGGEYKDQDIPSLTAMDAVGRWMVDKGSR